MNRTMDSFPNIFSAAIILAMVACASAAEPPPLGHKDFYPTPQRPLMWRGDGNGAYPGARPVSEWSESKNFLWKTPVPNYGNSSPLVVGDKVFVVSEPGWQSDCPTLACYDLATGKQLWVSDVDQFSGLPEAERADARARRKKYFEILRAANRLAYQAAQAKDDAEKEKLIEEIKTVSGGVLTGMAAYHCLAQAVARGKELELTQKYQFSAPTWWYSDIGMAYATPCSDGQRVFVATAHDSLHAFDLTGKQVWQQWHRDGFPKKGVPSDIRFTDSPLLVDGVLVRYANYRVRAYDPATGAMKWQTDGLRPAPGHSCGQMGVVRVAAAQGQPGFTALLTYSGELLRLSDGAVLKRGLCTANFVTIVCDGADTAFVAHNAKEAAQDAVLDPALDGPGLLALRFGQAADGSVTVTRRWRQDNAGPFLDHGHAPVYHNGVLYGGQHSLHALDAATGFVLWTASTGPTAGGAKPYSGPVKVAVGGGFDSQGWALGGDLLVAQFCNGYAVTIDTNGERRSSTFLPPMPDLTGPKRDQVIALSATDKYAMWYGWNGARSLPVFAGQRTLLRSFDWLYCFGPAVEGIHGDDAGKVATIRAETNAGKLESYLADASAQVRFEALKRFTAPVTSAQVVRILREDPYAENRAAAYRALGAEAGWREIAAMIPKAMPPSPPVFGAAEATVLRQDLVHTFRVLGDEGRALVAREWTAAKDPLTKRFLLHIAQSMAWRIEPILAEAKLAMEKPRSEMPQWHVQVPNNSSLLRCLPDYLARLDAAADPVLAEAMMKAYPKEWALYPTLARHLPAEKLLAWIEPIALESAHPSYRQRILAAWKAIGQPALPSMERVKSAMAGKATTDKLAEEYAKAIEEMFTAIKEK